MASSTPSKKLLWAGRVVSALPALMMLLSAFMKLSNNPQALEGFAKDGFPDGALFKIGLLEVLVVLIYLVPQTAVLGAILCVGYLGGAVLVHVRHGEAFVFPILLGALFWLGLWLRDPWVRALVPLRKPLVENDTTKS